MPSCQVIESLDLGETVEELLSTTISNPKTYSLQAVNTRGKLARNLFFSYSLSKIACQAPKPRISLIPKRKVGVILVSVGPVK